MTTYYLTDQAGAAPFPASSRLLSTTVTGSEVQLGPGRFNNTTPGNTRAGQVKPGVAISDGTDMPEIDSTAGVPGTSRIGWVFPFELTGKLLTKGRWELGAKLRANSGSGSAGRVAARVSVVRAVGGLWETVKQIFTTSIAGESSHSVGQVGWRSADDPVAPTGTSTAFVNMYGNEGTSQAHAFQAGEYLLLEVGYCDADSATFRAWRFDYNVEATYLRTPPIISGTADTGSLSEELGDALGEADLSCVEDMTADFAVASGRLALAQALARRWTTDRGGLIDDPDYGENLTDYINDDMSPADVRAVQIKAAAEASKDERVLAISSEAELTSLGVLKMEFTITDAEGPFSLTLQITSVTVEILRVETT